MTFTMLENGLDFVIDAVMHLKEAEKEGCVEKEKHIKYSLLHLSSGIELILKSRLYRENWTYIFADMNKANKKMLVNGELKSVDSATLINRLEILCDIQIEKKTKEAFEDLRKRRNQMEHFTVKDTFLSIEACINKALGEIIEFIQKNYNDFTTPTVISLKEDDGAFGLTEQEDRLMQELIKRTGELKKHYEDAKNMAIAKANDEALLEDLLECPSCREKLLKLNYNNKNICHCYLCAYEGDGEKVADEYLGVIKNLNRYEIVKDGGEYPLYGCPMCGKTAFLNIDDKFICFSCEAYYYEDEIGSCFGCGSVYEKKDEDLGYCPDCLEYKMNKD